MLHSFEYYIRREHIHGLSVSTETTQIATSIENLLED